MIAQYIPYAVAAILVAGLVIELRTGRIPNWLTLLPFLLFAVVAVVTEDRSALLWQLGQSAGVFVGGLLLFLFAGFGAGAVKLMTGVALFIPLSDGVTALMIFFGAMLLGLLLVIGLRNIMGSEQSKWHVLAKPIMPMSLPIAVTGLAVMFWV